MDEEHKEVVCKDEHHEEDVHKEEEHREEAYKGKAHDEEAVAAINAIRPDSRYHQKGLISISSNKSTGNKKNG